MSDPIVLIPARLASTRLPNKPLADIHGKPMIVHVLDRAREAAVGPVVVAAAEAEVVEAVEAAGGRAVLTDPDLPSGSDRIHQALLRIDPQARHDLIVNLQGDLPTLDPELIRAVLSPLADPAVDIGTLAVEIEDAQERDNPNVVKPVCAFAEKASIARALYFTRCSAPWDGGDRQKPLYHHIGIYAYRRAALDRFVALPPSPLELREKLEQLRALEAGMRVDVARVDTLPLGVDTPADLERARSLLAPR
ncbi:3-deoxy-manno-octulosonate cytidylyltransferase [Aquibaculum sediminis]|uniref:3-deoxy-manno-octulosonate cytidylyltransferase n=1 Tax=Aquibaculum sediminis TaxID=3231907 RepID=UPI0034520F48